MSTTTNGAHVEVVIADPLYIPPDPCHTSGRAFPSPLVRELLRSLGVTTCPDCHRYTGMAERVERPLRRKGTGWRERP